MLPKKLINKCLFLLNNTCRYTNVNYFLHIRNDYVSIDVYIYELKNKNIIKSLYKFVRDEDSFTKFSTNVVDFINENKEFIK